SSRDPGRADGERDPVSGGRLPSRPGSTWPTPATGCRPPSSRPHPCGLTNGPPSRGAAGPAQGRANLVLNNSFTGRATAIAAILQPDSLWLPGEGGRPLLGEIEEEVAAGQHAHAHPAAEALAHLPRRLCRKSSRIARRSSPSLTR